MWPRRVPTSNTVLALAGGTEDNDLWVERRQDERTLTSVWELSPFERKAIAGGATIELTVWGHGTPPVALSIGPSIEERQMERREP